MPGHDGRYVAALGGLALLLCAAAPLEESPAGKPASHNAQDSERSQDKAQPAEHPASPPPAPESQQGEAAPAQAAAGKRSKEEERERPKWTDVAQALSALVVMLFTGFLAWLSWRQHKLEERLASDTSESIEIARRSAEAALLSARVSEAALLNGPRPMLVVELVDYSTIVPEVATDSHPFSISFNITNSGERNATIESIMVELAVYRREAGEDIPPLPGPSRARFDSPVGVMSEELLPNSITLMPRGVFPAKHSSFVPMNNDELQAMWGIGLRRVLCLILITYTDPHNVRRERGLTWFYSPLAKFPDQWTVIEDADYGFDRVIDLGGLDFSRERGGDNQHS